MFYGGDFEYDASRESYQKPNERKKNIDSFVYDSSLSNLKTAVYISYDDKIILIAHRGTVLSDAEDIADDLAILSGTFNLTNRYKKALKLNKLIYDKFPAYRIINTGHSLGAKVASEVAKKQKLINSEAVLYSNPSSFYDLGHNVYDTAKCSINPKSNYCKKLKNQESHLTKYDPISILSFTGLSKNKVHDVKKHNPHTLKNFGGCLIGESDCLCSLYYGQNRKERKRTKTIRK